MKWIKKRLPKEDVYILLYIVSKENKRWYRVVKGSYLGRFYAVGGLDDSIEEVKYWAKFNEPKKKKKAR